MIYSWTPREFKNFIKGAQLRMIDTYELCAVQAFFTASANNSKKRNLKIKDIYDADKVRKEVDDVGKTKEQPLHLDRYRKAQEEMKKYKT